MYGSESTLFLCNCRDCSSHIEPSWHENFCKYKKWCIEKAAQQSVQSDDCPSCAGSGKKEIGGMLLTCLACDGTGNRR